jgi:hypothetical protein
MSAPVEDSWPPAWTSTASRQGGGIGSRLGPGRTGHGQRSRRQERSGGCDLHPARSGFIRAGPSVGIGRHDQVAARDGRGDPDILVGRNPLDAGHRGLEQRIRTKRSTVGTGQPDLRALGHRDPGTTLGVGLHRDPLQVEQSRLIARRRRAAPPPGSCYPRPWRRVRPWVPLPMTSEPRAVVGAGAHHGAGRERDGTRLGRE